MNISNTGQNFVGFLAPKHSSDQLLVGGGTNKGATLSVDDLELTIGNTNTTILANVPGTAYCTKSTGSVPVFDPYHFSAGESKKLSTARTFGYFIADEDL